MHVQEPMTPLPKEDHRLINMYFTVVSLKDWLDQGGY